MALFNNTPMQPTVAELQELISSSREDIQSGKGIASKPQQVSASKEDVVMGFFRDVFGATQEKAEAVREEIAPEMEELARRSVVGAVPTSLRPMARPDPLATRMFEDTADAPKDVEESAPVTAEPGLMSPVTSLRPKARDNDVVTLEDDSFPAFIREGSAFRKALADQEAESYSTIFGNAEKSGGKFEGKDVTKMKMSEVFEFVEAGGEFNEYNRDTYGKNTTAIGKYQMVGATLRDLRDRKVLDKLGIDEDTVFNKETQDKIAMHLAERRVKGKSLEAARKGLRNEWEGFKKLSKEELDAIIREIGR